MEDQQISKVEILIRQHKYDQSEKILKDLLSQDSNNVRYLSLLSEVYLQQGKLSQARDIIETAIGLSPDSAFLFYIKSRIEIENDNYRQAEKSIEEAIQLDAYDADYYAIKAHIKLVRKKFKEALQFADRSLEIDPENLMGLNTRSSALLKLDQSEESFNTIEGALREDPNNAYTHANYGWGLLEKGNHKKALEHFKESLQNDPNFEYAQAGMIEALKANNPIYRLFLKYSFWMANLTSKYQWGVIIGFYIFYRIIRSISKNNESLQPILTPVLILLAVVAFSTWVITPISNLFLRFNQYGKFLLSDKEKMSSNFVAISLAIFVIGILSFLVLSDDRFLTVAIVGFAMMIPLSVMYNPSKYGNSLFIYTIAMLVLGLLAIFTSFSSGSPFNLFTIIFGLGFIAFQWIANFLMIDEGNR